VRAFSSGLREHNAAGGTTASELDPPAQGADPRISTGNPGLDTMLEGGVIARRPYLIVGPAGTGKTTLALQFLCEGVRRGERCLLVTIEEPPNEARLNHQGLGAEFDRVEVFDAIPDVMRYERVPFKDISAVRAATPFGRVPLVIRRTPELTGVEVTITALEQMLRSEVARRGYTRVVIDSLTALQYFCMKGFNEVAGAQTFLRFLSELRVTTFLTVESPLEDVDTTERMLARGEIRLFRWELDDSTVRAIGVEKFRGGSHDIRLHPYRIGPAGLDINLTVTVSRDTRRIIEPVALVTLVTPTLERPVVPAEPESPTAESVEPPSVEASVTPTLSEPRETLPEVPLSETVPAPEPSEMPETRATPEVVPVEASIAEHGSPETETELERPPDVSPESEPTGVPTEDSASGIDAGVGTGVKAHETIPAEVRAPPIPPAADLPEGPPPPFPTRVATAPVHPADTPAPRPSATVNAQEPPLAAATRRPSPREPPVLPSGFRATRGPSAHELPTPGPGAPPERPPPTPSPGTRVSPPPLPIRSPPATPLTESGSSPVAPSREELPSRETATPPLGPPSTPEGSPATQPETPLAPVTEPKRKRKGPARVARKGEGTTELRAHGAGAPALPLSSAEAITVPPEEPGVPVPAKPRRRAVRKRKAPPVDSATAGEIPPSESNSPATEPSASAPPELPKEPE
jgi:KaiC/GvpD/RAD55 family RecA-like ATPase